MQITALIIEDEKYARESLEILVNNYCKQVKLIEEPAASVEEGIFMLNKHEPDLIFLDIQLGGRLAFELLDAFPDPDFAVIFTTAFNEYAVRAFRASAVDYLLKPIKIEELQEAVAKTQNQLLQQQPDPLNIFRENRKKINALMIPDERDVHLLKVDQIAYIKGDGNACTFTCTNTEKVLAIKNLGYFESILISPSDPQTSDFFRTHASWMVHYQEIVGTRSSKYVIMSNQAEIPISDANKAAFKAWLLHKSGNK